MFAKILTFPHLIYTAIYSIWFLGYYQPDSPQIAFWILMLWNPYSAIFFPVITFLMYFFFYSDTCKKQRGSIFDEEALKRRKTMAAEKEEEEDKDETEGQKTDEEEGSNGQSQSVGPSAQP